MRPSPLQVAAVFSFALCVASVRAEAPAIDLEVAADPNAPFGAQQTWYRLLNGMNLDSLRLRQARRGEEPSIENTGTEASPRYRLTAIVDPKNHLHLPAGRFTERDQRRLAEYLRKVREDGIEGVTASRGLFGLTEKQFQVVHAELSPRVAITTSGKRPREIVDSIADRLAHRIVIGPASLQQLDAAEPCAAELEKLSRGTVLAILLRRAGLAFRPQRKLGEVLYEVVDTKRADGLAARRRQDPGPPATWPVGWEPELNPGRTAPDLFEVISAQIDGYTLAEALEAIESRLQVPLILDRHGLHSREIDISHIQVTLSSGRYSYDRILSRILFQARLKGTIRVDERGTPFYWITPL